VEFIIYRGWPLALALPGRVLPHPALEALAERDESHPFVRFACALALHAFEIHAGLIEWPFDQARAERYVRELLMPAEAFGPLVWRKDAERADLFAVPIEDVRARSLDLAARPAGPGRPR
jgi:hypothetical protein